MYGTLDFDSDHWARVFIPNDATQTHSIFVKLGKCLFRHAKGKSVVNFYIVNALDQNLVNSDVNLSYSEIVVRDQNL